MTRDDIIRMAIEAGIDYVFAFRSELERFATLVISQHVKETRPEVAESMAEWLQQIAYQHGGIGDLSRTEMEFGAMVAAAEREACAQICDTESANESSFWEKSGWTHACGNCAAAIRARGEK